MADDRSEAKRFVEAFGEQGAWWFAQGLSFEAARDKYERELREFAERQRATIARIEKQLEGKKS